MLAVLDSAGGQARATVRFSASATRTATVASKRGSRRSPDEPRPGGRGVTARTESLTAAWALGGLILSPAPLSLICQSRRPSARSGSGRDASTRQIRLHSGCLALKRDGLRPALLLPQSQLDTAAG